MDDISIDRITPTGAHAVFSFTSASFLGGVGVFLPDGVAIVRDGSIVVDTDGADGYTNAAGIVQIGSGGHLSVLWKP